MPGKLLLAHDLGTSGNKATLFDLEGNLLASKTVPYKTYYFNVTWAEQDPNDWWEAVCGSTRALLADYDARDIGAICFSGQMMGCLAVDKRGIPLKRHILYCDQRSVAQTEELVHRIDPKQIYAISGHRPSPSYAIQKLMWLRDNEKHTYREMAKMLNAKDYINFRLTGRMVTETNDAGGTNALNVKTLQWADEIIEAAQVEKSKFPDIITSVDVVGEVTREAAEATGLVAGTPVVAGAGDGGCATVGIGCVRPGITYNYIGSSSWISTTTTRVLDDPAMGNFTWVHPVPGYMQPCGTTQTAGACYAWLKDQFGQYEVQEAKQKGISPYKLFDEQVATSKPGANGVLFLPHLLGERSPRWNPDAKGAFIGLTLEKTRADMFRAVLEGVTFNLQLSLFPMKQQTEMNEMRVLGGGAKGLEWRQILADIYDMPILIPKYLEEATSMGAAVIGGVGVGLLDSFDAVDDFVEFVERVEPIPENVATYKRMAPLFDQAYKVLEPLFGELTNI
ncbi:MAG: FGGY-family carbohydrate kinase [Sphaerochaetaceae bacterium]